MVTLEDLRRVSDLTVPIVGEIFNANELADKYEKTGRGGENFIAKLYVIESHVDDLLAAFSEDIEDAFAIANPEPVTGVDGHGMPSASAHEGMMHVGMHIGSVAYAVMSTARPGYYSPGTEYLCPRLVADDVRDAVAEEDMYKHVGVALAAYREGFPCDEELNRIAVMLRQELARAIKVLGQVPNKTTADSGQQNGQSKKIVPGNPHVTRLADKIRRERDTVPSFLEIARDFTNGNEKRAKSLLRQLRRFPHLLE